MGSPLCKRPIRAACSTTMIVDPRRRAEPEIESLMRALGADIRRARWQAGISQSGLEVLSGVDQTTISRLENGIAPGLRLVRLVTILAPIGLGSLKPSPVTERMKVTPWDRVL